MDSRLESEPLLNGNDPVSRKPSDTSKKVEDSKFPWKQLGVLSLCRLAEPIAFSSITSYSLRMVQHIKGFDNAPFYSGLLVSAFAFTEAIASMFWGNMSDRWGRKPIIIISLVGSACSSLLFGFSTNYWVAFAARTIGGSLNGNISVMQTMVAEIVTRPEHEPIAYAMIPFVWSVGAIVGASLGGYLAEPSSSYPNVFPGDGLFGRFPYLLPNLIAAVVTIIAATQGFFFLNETCEAVIKKRSKAKAKAQAGTQSRNETTSSTGEPRPTPEYPFSPTSPGYNGVERSYDVRRPSFTTSRASVDVFNPPPIRAFTNEVILWVVALFFLCWHQFGFNYLIPVYALDAPQQAAGHLDLRGGLGKTLPEVGTFLAVDAIIALLIQGFIYPAYVAKLGVWKAALTCGLFCPCVYLGVPFITMLPNPAVGVYISMALQYFCTLITYPSLLILLKNATPSLSVLGRVNGLALALCSGGRTLSPPVIGLVYSHMGSAAAWWSNAIIALIAIVLFCFIPKPKETHARDGDDDDDDGVFEGSRY